MYDKHLYKSDILLRMHLYISSTGVALQQVNTKNTRSFLVALHIHCLIMWNQFDDTIW